MYLLVIGFSQIMPTNLNGSG